MSDTMMKAIQLHDYGAADLLVLEETPRPQPKENEVLIRMKAAGVNPADWKYRSGIYKAFMPLMFPYTPGLDGAGVIEAVGSAVTTFQPGQAVYGFIVGSYAEYAVIAASEISLKPSNLSFDEAASVPVGALTAWQAVDDVGVQSGQRILVQGGAGGVGLFVVQLAHLRGAHVIATASAANVDFVESLGADEVIDYQAAPFESVVRDIDAVIDTVGGDLTSRSLAVLRPDGILTTVAGRVTPEEAQSKGVRAMSSHRAPPDKLAHVKALLENGQLKAVVGHVFPLSAAADAQKLSETGHGRGRIVLHIAD